MRRLTEILALNSSKISRFCISHWVYYRLETCLLVLIPRFCLGSYWPILLTLLLLIIYYQNSFIFLSLGHGPLSGWDTGLLTFLTSCMDIQNLPIFIFLGVFFLILFIFFVFLCVGWNNKNTSFSQRNGELDLRFIKTIGMQMQSAVPTISNGLCFTRDF